MKPQPIGKILRALTLPNLASAAEQAYRQGVANDRLMRMEAERARKVAQQKTFERQELLRLGRPEFLYLRNAQKKEAQYQRYLEGGRWGRADLATRRARRPLKQQTEEVKP